MTKIPKGRTFQLWEYRVSHGSLLIRSPKTEDHSTNVDVLCYDVLHVDAPRFIGVAEISVATEEDRRFARQIADRIQGGDVECLVMRSPESRVRIVCSAFKVVENQDAIVSSPFEHR